MRKILFWTTIIVLVVAGIVTFLYRGSVLPGVHKVADQQPFFVYKGNTVSNIADSLVKYQLISNRQDLIRTARLMRFTDKHLLQGRYQLKAGWNLIQLLDFLARGNQKPFNLVLNPVRTTENLAAFLGRQLAADSMDFYNVLSNEVLLDSLGVNAETVMTLFIPNTYEVYWTVSPKAFLLRMKRESDTFWGQNDRVTKADRLAMTKAQVYTLASIVDRETQANIEKPTIAGLYLNRINIGMPLQADPTVVFAVGDFTIKRVTNKHIAIESPYNTYLNKGLPPGPITMASVAGIDAVLNHKSHNYLYMCARPDNSGQHDFAETFAAHVINANRYREWLTQQGL